MCSSAPVGGQVGQVGRHQGGGGHGGLQHADEGVAVHGLDHLHSSTRHATAAACSRWCTSRGCSGGLCQAEIAVPVCRFPACTLQLRNEQYSSHRPRVTLLPW